MTMYFGWRFYAGDISKQLCYGATHDAKCKIFFGSNQEVIMSLRAEKN